MSSEFTSEQKRYLEGFMSGMQAMRAGRPAGSAASLDSVGHEGPDKAHLKAQDDAVANGGKLADQEKWKRAEHPFDAYARFRSQAVAGVYPKPEDNFRWRYHGLFYVAPAQDSYMCRMRIPNGILTHWQLAAVAEIAERLAGGYAHVTTRANLQIREIGAEAAPEVLERLVEAGITCRGSGADNIRNVTGSATAGIDAQELLDTRPPHDRLAHIGVHAQRQAGLNWIGVWTPLGRMTAAQMRALAETARMYGDGDIRLTVWQNLLVSGVRDQDVAAASAAIAAAGLATQVSNARAGLVACTGAKGCKFAASDTKGHALQIADHLDASLTIDQPVNIHLTGCHHSCAQHYIGDIGLIGAKVALNDDGDQAEGYHIHIGGGFGAQGAIGQLLRSDVVAGDAPGIIENLLRIWQARRADSAESFQAFTARLGIEELKRLTEVQ